MKTRKLPVRAIVLIVIFGLLSIPVVSIAQDSATSKTEFKPSGKIWGLAYLDYAYKLHADVLKRGTLQYSGLASGYNSFNFRRIYFGYDYQFSPDISAQFLLSHESTMESNPANPDELTDNNRAVYIKAMNLKFNHLLPRASIVIGQQSTPTFSMLPDRFWGYRSVEKTIGDMRGIASSTDLGLGIFGKIGKNENIGYDILFANNNGAKPENNNFKKIYTSLYAFFLDKKLVIQGNYEFTKTGNMPVKKNLQNLKALVAYKDEEFTVGVEAFIQVLKNNAAIVAGPSDTAFANGRPAGVSFYFVRQLKKDKTKLFARFDSYNGDLNFNSLDDYVTSYYGTKEYFATLGIDILLYKNIHLIPNIWYNRYRSRLDNTGGSFNADYDLVGRLTLYFQLNR